MAKITSLNDCVLELDGERKCAFCGTTLADGEVCTCNKYKLAVRNFGYIDVAQRQVEHYQQTIADLYYRMPEPSYEIREAIVPVPTEPEPPIEDDDGNGSGEPTDEGDE